MLVISQYPIKVVFYRTETDNEPVIVLLHSFIKKSQKIPGRDLNLAKKRLQILKGNL